MRFGQRTARRTSKSFSTTKSTAGAEAQHLRAFSNAINLKPSKLGLTALEAVSMKFTAFEPIATTANGVMIGREP
jgi:hypothetical protein